MPKDAAPRGLHMKRHQKACLDGPTHHASHPVCSVEHHLVGLQIIAYGRKLYSLKLPILPLPSVWHAYRGMDGGVP